MNADDCYALAQAARRAGDTGFAELLFAWPYLSQYAKWRLYFTARWLVFAGRIRAAIG